MKFLGIDYGSKRVGIALSDDDGKLAFPNTVLENNKELIKNIEEIYNREKAAGIVIGESLDSKGRPNEIMKEIIPFKEIIEKKLNIPTHFEPEFMTSHHAAIGEKKGEYKKEMIDSSAAALILQRFLDKHITK